MLVVFIVGWQHLTRRSVVIQNSKDVEQEEAQVCSDQPETGFGAQSYVIPTPMANFAPLSYQNYMMQPYLQVIFRSSIR